MELSPCPTGLPQVPIYFSSFRLEATKCDRLVLLIGKGRDDPLIHSRHLWDAHGVNTGSIVNFVRHAHSEAGTGIIIANPAQPLWVKHNKKAVTFKTWDALPRHIATDNAFEIVQDDFIPENANAAEHLLCLFKQLILPTIEQNPAHPKVYIICVDDTVRVLLQLLQQNWDLLKDHIGSVVSCNGYINPIQDFYNTEFIQFWADVSVLLYKSSRSRLMIFYSTAKDILSILLPSVHQLRQLLALSTSFLAANRVLARMSSIIPIR